MQVLSNYNQRTLWLLSLFTFFLHFHILPFHPPLVTCLQENNIGRSFESSGLRVDLLKDELVGPDEDSLTQNGLLTSTERYKEGDEDEEEDEEDYDRRIELGAIRNLGSDGQSWLHFEWKISDLEELIEKGIQLVQSPKFYLTEGGYRLQLLLIPNTTYADNSQFIGIFFRLVTGIHDSNLNWPFQYKTILTVVDQLDGSKNVSFTVTPNTDPCRVRSAFLRPSTDKEYSDRPDGCGNRRHLSLDSLLLSDTTLTTKNRYLRNGSLSIQVAISEKDRGEEYKEAKVFLKYNNLVSEHIWSINNFSSLQKESADKDTVLVLSSEPFYTHSGGYLMQMFMTLLPQKKAFAISTALAQGDFDRLIQWPFPYEFEVAIIDESPGYWRRDYSVNLHPSSSECGSSPFLHPVGYPEFCFITIQSIQLLTLPHYHFISSNGTLKIRFTTKFTEFGAKESASLTMKEGRLVAEYAWLIPDLETKMEKFAETGKKVKLYTSRQFYTNGQGYLVQLILSLNTTTQNRSGSCLGLEMAILEGPYDSILEWPFNKTFELIIINQRLRDDFPLVDIAKPGSNSTAELYQSDVLTVIQPDKDPECGSRSFSKPVERNPPCGRKNLISFKRISRSNSFFRLGNLLVKTRIYL